MMGAPIDEPFYCYRDNMSAIKNTQNTESTLKKKSNLICYHYITGQSVPSMDIKQVMRVSAFIN
jgi:hypothetical protein